jgi:hypothetical protein
MEMDDQRPAAPAAPAATHMAPRRRPSRGLLVLALLLIVVVGGAAAVLLSGGDDEADGQGVVLLAAASPGRDDFADDLDLLAPDQRAQPGGVRVRLPSADLAAPVALAGLGIRGAEPGLYTAARDEPTCDVDQLGELLLVEGGDEPDPVAVAWFAAIARNIDGSEHEDYLDGLTAVRLRLDTRVVAHGFVDGAAVAYPAVLQAGTAVLVDEMGVPRVRCTGGTPLGEADPASGMSREATLDLDARASNPDAAWAGFDPAAVVVVEARPTEDGFELASATGPDDDGDETFLRATGSNGDRDRAVFTPDDGDPAAGCGDDCRQLEIAITSEGALASLVYDGVADPSEADDQRLFWSEAAPTTYKFSLLENWKVFGQFGPGEEIPPPPWDDPAVEGENIILEPADPTEAVPVTRLMECIPGPVTITITVDGAVAQELTEDITCISAPPELEFVLE